MMMLILTDDIVRPTYKPTTELKSGSTAPGNQCIYLPQPRCMRIHGFGGLRAPNPWILMHLGWGRYMQWFPGAVEPDLSLVVGF